MEEHPFATLNRLGWSWHENGVVLSVVVDGAQRQVFVPLDHIVLTFGKELATVGCRFPHQIGAHATISGWFSGLKHAFKRVTRAVKRVVPKRIMRAATKVYNTALKVARVAHRVFTSREAMLVVGALGVAIPVLAPAAAGIAAAQLALRKIDAGIAAAQAVRRGIAATPKLVQAMRTGQSTSTAIKGILGMAKQGHQGAQQFAGALAQLAGGG